MSKKVAIISGSIRKDAFSKQLAEAVQPLFPEGYETEIAEIGNLPLYSQDYDSETQPEAYTRFRDAIRGIDAVLFVTPEHNRSFPAALKNALDIGSRPYGQSVWNGKPAAVISNSPGLLAGFGANHHLRQVLTFLNMPTLQQPEAYFSKIHELLDGNGVFKTENTRAFAQTIVDAFVTLIERY